MCLILKFSTFLAILHFDYSFNNMNMHHYIFSAKWNDNVQSNPKPILWNLTIDTPTWRKWVCSTKDNLF